MKVVKTILKVLGIVLLLLLVVSFFLPGDVRIERSITINASPDVVFTQIGDLKKWDSWSPWKKRDPNMVNNFSGPDGAVGQKNVWKSDHPKVGDGEMTIVEHKPNELLVTEMYFGAGAKPKGIFTLEKAGGDSTKIVWAFEGKGKDVPWYMKPMSKYMNLMLDGMLGPDFEEGLKGIKTVSEAAPKAPDLSKLTYKVEEIMVDTMIVLASPIEKISVDKLQQHLGRYFGEMYNFTKRQKLKPGAPSAIYHSWNGTETEIEVILPVDKFPPLVQGGFPAHFLGGGWALKVDYYGGYAGSEKAHMDIATYAAAKNIKVGAPWEMYITDPATEKDTSKWLTQIYYPMIH